MTTHQSDRIVDPPFVDHLWFDDASNSFVVTFVPDEGVSNEATEVVHVHADSSEGRLIAAHFAKLKQLLYPSIVRIGHCGGDDFIFHLDRGEPFKLSSAQGSAELGSAVHDELNQIAQAAQCAFQIQSLEPRAK